MGIVPSAFVSIVIVDGDSGLLPDRARCSSEWPSHFSTLYAILRSESCEIFESRERVLSHSFERTKYWLGFFGASYLKYLRRKHISTGSRRKHRLTVVLVDDEQTQPSFSPSIDGINDPGERMAAMMMRDQTETIPNEFHLPYPFERIQKHQDTITTPTHQFILSKQ